MELVVENEELYFGVQKHVKITLKISTPKHLLLNHFLAMNANWLWPISTCCKNTQINITEIMMAMSNFCARNVKFHSMISQAYNSMSKRSTLKPSMGVLNVISELIYTLKC